MIWVKIKKLDSRIPELKYQTNGAGGIDLYNVEPITLLPNDSCTCSFGICVSIPTGYVGIITTRSSLGFKYGVESRLGVIDSDYRGEVKGKFYNNSSDDIYLKPFQRVAQLLILPCPQAIIQEVDELDDTVRGDGGFGSTGVS